jgi:glucokinase
MLLAGDIGGTKTTLAVFSTANGPRRPLSQATFASDEYSCLQDVVRAFLAQNDTPVRWACFGVAGPVVDRQAQVTNLPWKMHEAGLAEGLNLEAVHLINDLESIANAVPLLTAEDLHTLNRGAPAGGGAIAVIAPGTGLGEAFLTWQGGHYEAHPSEGGHADYAPTNELEVGLWHYLQQRFGHTSWERVCSGIGIPNIYAYLRQIDHGQEPDWFEQQLAEAEDITPLVVTRALSDPDNSPLCTATLDLFVAALGTETGNLALKVLATGGVYLGGGIPPRILPALDKGTFMRAFTDKGRFAALMERLPVHVILNPQAALLGAARYGLEAHS